MTPFGLLLLAVIILLPIAWLVAEFRGRIELRILLGLLTITILTFCSWALSSVINHFNYNAWYGGATGELVSTSLKQIEDGHLDRVLTVWRGLNHQYRPTYENRANYDELVQDATARMRGDVPIEPTSAWDATVFQRETWLGHWEDNVGYWIVIDDFERPYVVIQSGQPRAKVHNVTVSPDFRILTFEEGDHWRHTLTLKNKYEASYEWFDLQAGTVWRTETIYKLIRATDEQKAMTQQAAATNAAPPTHLQVKPTPPAVGK
jgi:hypothetical protein